MNTTNITAEFCKLYNNIVNQVRNEIKESLKMELYNELKYLIECKMATNNAANPAANLAANSAVTPAADPAANPAANYTVDDVAEDESTNIDIIRAVDNYNKYYAANNAARYAVIDTASIAAKYSIGDGADVNAQFVSNDFDPMSDIMLESPKSKQEEDLMTNPLFMRVNQSLNRIKKNDAIYTLEELIEIRKRRGLNEEDEKQLRLIKNLTFGDEDEKHPSKSRTVEEDKVVADRFDALFQAKYST